MMFLCPENFFINELVFRVLFIWRVFYLIAAFCSTMN